MIIGNRGRDEQWTAGSLREMVGKIIAIFQVASIGCAFLGAYSWHLASSGPLNVAERSRLNARAAKWTTAFLLVQTLVTFASILPAEWMESVVAIACIPALLVSYLLPFSLIAFFLGRRNETVENDTEYEQRKWWGFYQTISGVVLLVLVHDSRLMLLQGAWIVFCGLAILLFGKSWFASAMLGRKKSIP